MPRTLGKISQDGQDLTDFVPVRVKTELGMCIGHMNIPSNISARFKPGNYTLRLKDDHEIRISFSGVCGPTAYFHSVGA
jgi:hypothetical protein